MLQLYLVKQATIWQRANDEVHVSKVKQQTQSKREVRGSEQMFEVLSISSHIGVQPSMPLIYGLVDNTLLQTRPCGNQVLRCLLPSNI